MILIEIVYAAVQLVSIDWNVGVMNELGQRNTTFELLHYFVTFQRSSEVTNPKEPPYFPQVTKFAFCEVSCGPEIGYRIHFHIGLFRVPHDRFRCQSGSLTHFTLGQHLRRGVASS